jgi:hypothetical protein
MVMVVLTGYHVDSRCNAVKAAPNREGIEEQFLVFDAAIGMSGSIAQSSVKPLGWHVRKVSGPKPRSGPS